LCFGEMVPGGRGDDFEAKCEDVSEQTSSSL
jgi:hypothetical protein